MKLRKIAIWLLLLSLWGGSMAFANTAVQKVRVLVNSIELDEGGQLIDGKTFLPLRQVAVAMQALVEWDSSTSRAMVYKPNVHMFVYNVTNDGDKTFGAVDKGFSGKIKVFAQIDSLEADINAVKVTISDPYGRERTIQSEDVKPRSDNFWFMTKESDYKFDATGQYTVRFHMRLASSKEWFVVSEKVITSRTP